MFLLDGTEVQFCVHQHSCFGISEADLTCCVCCVGICKLWPGFTAAGGTWQLGGKGSWKQGQSVRFLERRGQLMIHSSFCLTFGKINGLHGFELELVGWVYLAFWFQWYSSCDKDSVLPEPFVHYVCSRANISSLDLNMAKRCLCPVPFLLCWLLCFYQCVNFTTKTF